MPGASEEGSEGAAAPARAGESLDDALPPWLTAAFLQEILSGSEAAPVRVAGFHAERAVGKGDNYASFMLRVAVDVEEGAEDGKGGEGEGGRRRASRRRLVAKGPPENELSRVWVERAGFFAKERRMYADTLPRMQRLLEQRLRGRGGGATRLAPRALPGGDSAGVLVFEDLSAEGFRMAERRSGLDLAHCMLATRTLAAFHALSLAARRDDPACVDYPETFYVASSRDEMNAFLPRTYATLADRVKTWPGYEHYADKLILFSDNLFDKIFNMLAETPDQFKVLNHGDCWVNNMLFKYSEDTGEPIDIRFLDFQITRYTSMVMDLQYFIFSSPRSDIRLEKMDEILRAYHTTYTQALEELGLPERAITWEQLQAEMDRALPFGLSSACNLLPIVVAAPSEALSLDGVSLEDVESGEADLFGKAMAGDIFASALKPLLPYFEQKGAL